MKEFLDKLNSDAEKVLREVYSIGRPLPGEEKMQPFIRFLAAALMDENADMKLTSALDRQDNQNFQGMYAFQDNDLWAAAKQAAESEDLRGFPEELDEQSLEDYAANCVRMMLSVVPNDSKPEPQTIPAD
jgi:hypothetical protein